MKAAPAISMFPGSETFLMRGLAAGGAGCISATMNLNAGAIRAVYEDAIAGRDVAAADTAIKAFRKTVQDGGLVPAMKAALAVRSGDKRWLRLRAPLRDATAEKGSAVLAQLGSTADHIGKAN